MADLIAFLEERVEEDMKNAVTDREKNEAEFKSALLTNYEVFKDIAAGKITIPNQSNVSEKFGKIVNQKFVDLYILATTVYDFDKIVEKEYYEQHETSK